MRFQFVGAQRSARSIHSRWAAPRFLLCSLGFLLFKFIMGEIVKFPGQPPKLGYKRVKKRAAENPGQLVLFSHQTAEILEFAAGLSGFERALLHDERGDAKAADLYRKAIQENDCVADAYCNLGIIESK